MNPFRIIQRSLLAAVIALGVSPTSRAAVTYVNPTDIVIPFTFEGVYLDLETGAGNGSTAGGSAADDSYTLSYTEPASGDWDLNFFFGGALMVHNTTFQPYREDSGSNLSAINKVGLGTVIDGTAVAGLDGSTAPLSSVDFGVSGTTAGGGLDGNPLPTHMGAAPDQFASGSGTTGYIAFVLNPGAGEQYGWMQVTLADDGSTGLIHDWAYSDSPLQVGTVPEPSSVLMLLAGMGALGIRRRG